MTESLPEKIARRHARAEAGVQGFTDTAIRVAARMLKASYFGVDDIVLYGKYKNHRGKIVGFGQDKWGNPTVEIEPIPKGRKQNKVMGLFRIWRADVKEKALDSDGNSKAR